MKNTANMLKPLFIILFSVIQLCTCSNILGIFPSGTKSHDMLTSILIQELSERGHNVTVLTVYPELYTGVRTIYLAENKKMWNGKLNNSQSLIFIFLI